MVPWYQEPVSLKRWVHKEVLLLPSTLGRGWGPPDVRQKYLPSQGQRGSDSRLRLLVLSQQKVTEAFARLSGGKIPTFRQPFCSPVR